MKYTTTESDWAVGLFACSNNPTFKNLTINNVDIDVVLTDDGDWGHIGAVIGYASGTTTIENIEITGDVKIKSTEEKRGSGRIGGIIGGNYGNFIIRDVVVDVNADSYVKGSSSIGGIAGQLQGSATFSNIESNIDVSANVFGVGGIIGIAAEKTTFETCSVAGNVSVINATSDNNLYRIGGIAGCWADNLNNNLVLTECVYTGTLSNGVGNAEFDCGGYVGRGYSALINAVVCVNGVSYTYNGNGEYGVGNSN